MFSVPCRAPLSQTQFAVACPNNRRGRPGSGCAGKLSELGFLGLKDWQDFFLSVIASRRRSNPEMADCPTDWAAFLK
jgi:hypothetical protein